MNFLQRSQQRSKEWLQNIFSSVRLSGVRVLKKKFGRNNKGGKFRKIKSQWALEHHPFIVQISLQLLLLICTFITWAWEVEKFCGGWNAALFCLLTLAIKICEGRIFVLCTKFTVRQVNKFNSQENIVASFYSHWHQSNWNGFACLPLPFTKPAWRSVSLSTGWS